MKHLTNNIMEITLVIISINLCYIGYVLNEILKKLKNR